MRQDRLRNHRRINDAAIQLIARHGPDGVSFEEVARLAEVSRGTLYNHYRSLDDVIVALARPVLEAGIAYFEERDGEIDSIDSVLGVFCMMWTEFGESLRLIEMVRTGELEPIRRLHERFLERFRSAVSGLPAEDLPLGHELSERIISSTFLGLLESLDGEEEWARLFMKIMRGALWARRKRETIR